MLKFDKKHIDFDKLYWLTGLKGIPDDTRHHINTIHVESGLAAKTDGCRLYLATLDTVSDGDYEIAKRTKSQVWICCASTEGKWPNIESVFDSLPIKKNHIESLFTLPRFDTPGKTVSSFYLNLYQGDIRPLINSDYVSDCLNGFDYVDIYCENEDSPVFFIQATDIHSIEKVAAVMPMRK